MRVGDKYDGGTVLSITPGFGIEARAIDGRRVWIDLPGVVDDDKPAPAAPQPEPEPETKTETKTEKAPKVRTTAIKAPRR